jgi:hypothetical protein
MSTNNRLVMKNSPIASTSGRALAARPFSQGCFAALVAGLLSISLPVVICRAQPADDEGGAEVLTRGPVHEAFAGVVSFNPEPGIVVTARPPEAIEEIPPEEKPEGDDVAWIPGYWAWDDERNDFLWISGTWRTLPPGREWMAGYWRDTGQGYQWISGYWADAAARETTYLPPPPATLEIGANLAAPSDDYGWTPGCWIWQQDRYAWRAGYWAEGRADWVWVPAYYVWTPRGVIFVDGFWDYPLEQRGVLFAPVYYQSRGYARRGYSYSPRVVINLSIFSDSLFLRPSYHHYYFGDYYDSRYERDGFYASYTYQSRRSGYDPFYSHDRWEHRTDRDWDNRVQASYQYRRENVAARPPRTWAAQLTINAGPVPTGQTRIVMAARLDQLAARKDSPVRFQPVAQGDRQQLAQRGREVQSSRDERRTVEAKAVVPAGRNGGQAVEPARVTVRPSPIVARPAGPTGGNQAPPERPKAPRPDLNVAPRAEAPGRPSNPDQRNSPAATRPPEPDRNAPVPRETRAPSAGEQRSNAAAANAENDSPRRVQQDERANAAKDREESQRKTNESQAKAQQDDERRTKEANQKSQAAEKTQREEQANVAKDRGEELRKAQEQQQQAAERTKANEAKPRDEPPQKARAPAGDARPEAGQRANDAAERPDAAARAKPAAEQPRGNAAPAKAQEAPPRNPKESVGREKPPADQPAKDKPANDKEDDPRKDKAREP